MKYDKNTEPKTYFALLWRGWNKFVLIIPILIGILSIVSIQKYPEYAMESALAAAFMVSIEILFLMKMWSFYQEIKKEGEELRKMGL